MKHSFSIIAKDECLRIPLKYYVVLFAIVNVISFDILFIECYTAFISSDNRPLITYEKAGSTRASSMRRP